MRLLSSSVLVSSNHSTITSYNSWVSNTASTIAQEPADERANRVCNTRYWSISIHSDVSGAYLTCLAGHISYGVWLNSLHPYELGHICLCPSTISAKFPTSAMLRTLTVCIHGSWGDEYCFKPLKSWRVDKNKEIVCKTCLD